MGFLLLLVVHDSTPWFIPKIPYGLPISLHFVQTSIWVPPGKDFILTCLPYSIGPSLGEQNPSWVCPFAARVNARVKVNKARRANQTKAHGSCFCCSSQQFNETWCDQMQNAVALENCNLVGLGCRYCIQGSLHFVQTSHCVATQGALSRIWLCIQRPKDAALLPTCY